MSKLADIASCRCRNFQGLLPQKWACEIQKFAGALQRPRARKGFFITSSNFSKDALDFTGMIESTSALIDGKELAQLMIDHNIGVSTIDSSYLAFSR